MNIRLDQDSLGGGMLHQVRKLTPLIRQHQTACEEAYGLTPAVQAALSEGGIYGATLPREVGGGEVDLPSLTRAAEKLGFANLSVAWSVMDSLSCGFVAARLLREAREEIFADSGAAFAIGFSPSGRAIALAGVTAEIQAARAGLFEATERAWEAMVEGPEVPRELRAGVYGHVQHAHKVARESISRLYTHGGMGALRQGHLLEQTLRDVHALSVNWERDRQIYFDAGRVLLGLEPVSPAF